MSRRLLPAVLAATLVLGLAACAEEPAPERPATINITMPSDGGGDTGPSDGGGEAEPSDSGGDSGAEGEPSADAPDVPPPNPADYPHRNLRSPEGAEQAVRYYIALVFWGQRTGEADQLEHLKTDSCGGCQELIEGIYELDERQQFWGEFDIEDAGIKTYGSDLYEHEVGYVFTLGQHEEPIDADGAMATAPTRDYVARAGLEWWDDGWKITALAIEEA